MGYLLGTRPGTASIKVMFPKNLLEEHIQLRADTPLVKTTQERLKLPPFVKLVTEEGWAQTGGYYGNLLLMDSRGDTLVYEVVLPERLIETCPACEGDGKRCYADIIEPCSYCDGSGEAFVPDYRKANGVCASLSMLFYWLNYQTEDSPMRISTTIDRGRDGGSMSVELSTNILDWLADISKDAEHQFGYVNTMMIKAYQWMARWSRWDMEKVKAIAIDGRLSIECPGDRSGLFRSGMPNQLLPHNLDTSIQQLTLLAGLARMQEDYRMR